VTNLTELSNLATGLSIVPIRTEAFIFVRGVGQSVTAPNADPSIAINVNGVYTPAEIAGNAIFDVDRIEVLPGPQGTLYGRNSTGGALNLATRTPGQTFDADGYVEYGNHRAVNSVLGVDIPLSDTLFSRIVGTVIRHDGYDSNGEDDQKAGGVRETLVWVPSDRTKVTAVATYTNAGGIGDVLQNVPYTECGPRCDTFDPRALGYYNKANCFQSSFNAAWELTDNLTLSYIGGYSRLGLATYNSIWVGPPVAPLYLNENVESQSHELRLNGDFDKFTPGRLLFRSEFVLVSECIDPANRASLHQSIQCVVTR
jgi:iron complex outermembrane recepter protein